MTEIVSSGEEDDILTILAEHVTFLPQHIIDLGLAGMLSPQF